MPSLQQPNFLPATDSKVKAFRLDDLQGKRVFSEDSPSQRLDLPELSLGVYFWEMILESGSIQRGKLLKQ